MKYRCDNRVLGAIRWIDAVTRAPITVPLVPLASPPNATHLRFIRNFSGLTVITHADGLETYTATFNLDDLDPGDAVPALSLELHGQVTDPTGNYLPRRFTLDLPLDADPTLTPPDNTRPPNSLFEPIDVELLPSPSAKVPAGWAQVRVLILDAEGDPIPHALARVVATAADPADEVTLGFGQSDSRGEALVAIPGLKNFAPGATEDEVVTIETAARLEIVFPPPADDPADWTALKTTPVAAPADIDPTPLALSPGRTYSRRYPF